MRTPICILVSLAAIVMSGHPLLAQGTDVGLNGPLALLQLPQVRKELKLSDDQQEKLFPLIRTLHEKHRGDYKRLRALGSEERKQAGRNLVESDFVALAAALTPTQVERLRQILLQDRGAEAFTDPTVQKALALTENQKQKIEDLYAAYKVKKQEALTASKENYEMALEKLSTLRKETVAKMIQLLSPIQKKSWKLSTGASFEIQLQPASKRKPPA